MENKKIIIAIAIITICTTLILGLSESETSLYNKAFEINAEEANKCAEQVYTERLVVEDGNKCLKRIINLKSP
jgi:hypothetical protein